NSQNHSANRNVWHPAVGQSLCPLLGGEKEVADVKSAGRHYKLLPAGQPVDTLFKALKIIKIVHISTLGNNLRMLVFTLVILIDDSHVILRQKPGFFRV